MNKTRWPQLTPEQRFRLKVYPRGDCWEWRGYLNANTGYGRFSHDSKPINAHSYAFALAKGRPPSAAESGSRIVLDHICRHPWCVKPSHLVVATRRQNYQRSDRYTTRANSITCLHGHPWDTSNTYIRPNGKRYCIACQRNRKQ